MNSPDSDIGREVRCPECGAVRLVPMGDTHGLDLAGGADRDRLLEGEPVEIPQVRSASSIACPQCGRAFAITEQLCSQCGWVNATTVERLSIPDELMPQEDSPLPPRASIWWMPRALAIAIALSCLWVWLLLAVL